MKKKLMLVAMCVCLLFSLVGCGDKSDGGSSKSNYDKLSEEEKLIVGRWMKVDGGGFFDFYSDGTGWSCGSASDEYEGDYFEWEYDQETGEYVVLRAHVSLFKYDENGLNVSKHTFVIEDFVVPEEADNLHGFVSAGSNIKLAKDTYSISQRYVRADQCDVDVFGWAAEGSNIRTYPEYEDGKQYNVPKEKGKKSIAAYRTDRDAYKDSLTEK